MRLQRTLGRFIVATVATATAFVPALASATAEPPGREPNPALQPVFHRSQASGAVVGALSIPALGVDEVIRSGVAPEVIDAGVAQWAGSVGAGGDGNVVLAGHRTTHHKPFEHLDDLDPGDLIYLTDGSGFPVLYRVTTSFVVEPKDMWITYDTAQPTLTLFACHPKGSARYRIVVTADLVAGRRIA